MKLHLPEKFVNTVPYVEYDIEGKRIYRSKRVESPTGVVRISFSGPLGQSYSEEALKTKKVLEIKPGESVDFSDEEAKFLMERYPFLQELKADAPQNAMAEANVAQLGAETLKAPSVNMSEAPTNFMEFKKWAAGKGVQIVKEDNKESITKKLLSINQ